MLVDHNGSEGSCGLAETAALQVSNWKEETQTGVRHFGWVHSHHSLPQQPSAADLRQQVDLQSVSPNTFMVVLKAGCCAQAWQIPLGIWRDLRTLGVDSSYPATDYLEAVELQERSSGPKVEATSRATAATRLRR